MSGQHASGDQGIGFLCCEVDWGKVKSKSQNFGSSTYKFYAKTSSTTFQGQINEANQRAFYQRWLDLMKADSWKTVPQRDVPKMKEGV